MKFSKIDDQYLMFLVSDDIRQKVQQNYETLWKFLLMDSNLSYHFSSLHELINDSFIVVYKQCSCGEGAIFLCSEEEYKDLDHYVCPDCIHDRQYNTRQEAAELETQKKLNDQFYSDFKNARR